MPLQFRRGPISSLSYFQCLDPSLAYSEKSHHMDGTKWCEITEVIANGTVEESTVGMCFAKSQTHYQIAQDYWASNASTSSVMVACSDDQWLEWTPAAIIAFMLFLSLVFLPAVVWVYAKFRRSNKTETTAEKALLSFNIESSVQDLMAVRGGGGTAFLDAFRVLSMSWIIMGHCEALFSYVYTNRDYWLHEITDTVLYSSYEIAVNTFFWTGAYLGAGGMLKKLTSSGAPQRSEYSKLTQFITKGYILRYLRVVPMIVFTIVAAWVIVPRLGRGLEWRHYYSVMTMGANYDCLRYWWTNLLFINTYKMGFCLPWTWYITTDFHFFLLLPFLVIPFVYFGKNVGLVVNIVALAVTLTFVAVQESYVKANSRASPFIMGVLCAFFMTYLTKRSEEEALAAKLAVKEEPTPLREDDIELVVQNCSFSYVEPPTGEEEDDTYCTSVTLTKEFCDAPWVRCLFYVVCAGSLILVMYDFHKARTPDSVDLPLQLRLVKEIFWPLGISCISIPFILGHGGVVKKCLSFPIWTVLGKLTFGAYLVHPVLIVIFACSAERIIYSRSISYLLWLGVTLLSYICSFLLWCIVECPFSKVVFIFSNKLTYKVGAIASLTFFISLFLYGVFISEYISDPAPIRVTVYHPPTSIFDN